VNQIIQEFLRPLLHDLFVHRKAYVAAIVLILALFTAAGVYWPARYSSSVTVFVEQRNILGPLMEGTAVQTDIRAQAGLAGELIYGRKILGKVASDQGLVHERMHPAEVDKIFEEIRDRTSIDLVGDNLIEIQYSDSDPDRTYKVTSQFAELFINESATSKINESQAAFDFIDKRVSEYAARLDGISNAIKQFRSENQSIVPGAEAEIRARIQDLQTQIEAQQQQIREAEVKAEALRTQLSGERQSATVANETDQIQQRISTLQAKLDTLQLSYHDKYPDIIALKDQIDDLKALAREGGVVVPGSAAADRPAGDPRGQEPVFNAVGQQLRQEQYNNNTLIATLKARLADSKRMLEVENERVRRIPEFEATLSELNRDLEVNQTLYNDLIRRREYARVSMNVDQENQGLTLRIHEPAGYPTNTSGPRLIHFVAMGLLMAIFGPLGAILAKQQTDQKIRISQALETVDPGVPVFVEIAHLATPGEARALKFEYGLLACVILLAIGGAGAVGFLRMSGLV
jgi:polysaccharide chain length determinant protein (PEP-CTERM system associated)